MEGPYGSNQYQLSQSGWDSLLSYYDPKDYNEAYGFDYYHNWPHERINETASNRNGNWNSKLYGRLTSNYDGSQVVRTYLLQLSDLKGKVIGENNAIDGKTCFPAGEYGLDFIFVTASQTGGLDVISMKWGIGDEYINLPIDFNNLPAGNLYVDERLTTNGGPMWFEFQADTYDAEMVIEPLKVRVHNDIVVAKKRFRLNEVCNNPYVWGSNDFDKNSKMTIVWKNRLGAYERWDFTLDSKKTLNIDRRNFSPSKSRDSFGLYSGVEGDTKNYSISGTEQFLINSDWMTQAQGEWIDELLTSTEVYIETDRSLETEYKNFTWIPVLIQDSQYTYKTQIRDKKIKLALTINVANNINNIS
jgi:hypothetical protein